ATHDGRSFPAMAVSEAADVELESEQFDFIGIDEVQFFGPPIVAVCDRLLAAGKELIVVGIDFNVRGKPFEPFPALKARASQISVMQCECDICGRPARHSQRLTPVVNNNWVGGRESYSPRCQDCFEPYQGELEP
ncbi:MAG: thymidine kinase, partial [Phycisphaerae bacterium]